LRNWFRIGFEPLFVDYTKAGSWFAAYALVEAAVIACVGVLIDNSQVQLLIFLGLNVVQFVLVVRLTPFANRVVESMAACRVGTATSCCGARNDETQTTEVARPCIPAGWGATWCKMTARNAAAYAEDVTNGLRLKPHSA
ncbi:unnamed protein product, partial [Ectocarpus sp. 13 AM-2016]